MRVLVVDDDRVWRRMLEAILTSAGYQVTLACDGEAAWQVLQDKDVPELAVVDWLMPGLDGLELCRRVRESPRPHGTYLILLTAKGSRADIVAGLKGGADDYLSKPFDPEELQARLQVGRRMITLQRSLADRVTELEDALARVKQLQGLLPICAYCKQIRDDQNYWHQVEAYICHHSEARFSHGICPPCYEKIIQPELQKMRAAAAPPAQVARPTVADRDLCAEN